MYTPSVPGVVLLECPARLDHQTGATPFVWCLRGCQQATMGAQSGPEVFTLGIPCFTGVPSLTVMWEPDGNSSWLGDHNLLCPLASVACI